MPVGEQGGVPVGGSALKAWIKNKLKNNPAYAGNTDIHGVKPKQNLGMPNAPREPGTNQPRRRKPQTGSSSY